MNLNEEEAFGKRRVHPPDDGLPQRSVRVHRYLGAEFGTGGRDPAEHARADVVETRYIHPRHEFRGLGLPIAQFKVMEYRSSLARDRLIFDDDLIQAIATESEQYHLADSERSRALDGCLDRLPPAQRDLLHKRYADDHSVTELAEQMQRPVGSLAVTLFRIRKTLLDCMERKLAAGRR